MIMDAGRGRERAAPRAAAAAGGGAGALLEMPSALRSASLLGQLRAKIEAAQSFLFGALFFMTDRGGRDPDVVRGLIIPVSLVIADALQLLSLALSSSWHAPSVKWCGPSRPRARPRPRVRMRHRGPDPRLDLLTSGLSLAAHFESVSVAALGLYWGLAALLAATFALVIYASLMFKEHRFRVLPIRVLWYHPPSLPPSLVSAPTPPPSLQLLAAPFFCSVAGGAGRGPDDPDAWMADFCDSTPWMRLRSSWLTLGVSAVLLALHVPFAALVAAVFHDNDPLSVDVGARAHGRVQLLYVLFQSALVFLSRALGGRHPVAFASFLLGGCLLLACLVVLLLPHYSNFMNMLRAGCFLSAAVFALGSIVLAYSGPESALPVSLAFIFLISLASFPSLFRSFDPEPFDPDAGIPVALLGAFAVRLRHRGVLRRVLHKARTGSFGDFEASPETERGEEGADFAGGFPAPRRRRGAAGLGFGFGLLSRSRGFLVAAQVELEARAAVAGTPPRPAPPRPAAAQQGRV
eukprot:tig00000157_g9599.t1